MELDEDGEEGYKHNNIITSRENETCCKYDYNDDDNVREQFGRGKSQDSI